MRRLAVLAVVAAGALAPVAAASTPPGVIIQATPGAAPIPVQCTCTYTIELTVVERLRHGRVVAISASRPKHLHGDKTRIVLVARSSGTGPGTATVKLNDLGRRLAKRFKTLHTSMAMTTTPVKPTPTATPCVPGPQALPTPPPGGPGPTGIEGGIYVVGGPINPCGQTPTRPPSNGTVVIFDSAGTYVTSQAVTGLFSLSLAPGTYTVRAQFSGQPIDTTHPDKNYCRAPEPVTVTDGDQTAVAIYCDVP